MTIGRTLNIPLFCEFGAGFADCVPEILDRHDLQFARISLISDETCMSLAGQRIADSLSQNGCEVDHALVGQPGEGFLERWTARTRESKPDAVFGVGGGTVIDLGKMIAHQIDTQFISVPTSLAHDGIASPIAVIHSTDQSRSVGVDTPLGIIVDLDVVRKAPKRITLAGVGDLLANLSALEDWRLAAEKKRDKFDGFSASLSRAAAMAILSQDGANPADTTFIRTLVEGLILSGIAMSVSGTSRPCSGAEHQFSHALDQMGAGRGLHGEQVAIGTIIMNTLRPQRHELLGGFITRCGLPSTLTEIDVSEEQAVEALMLAPQTRPGRYTILDELVLDRDAARKALRKSGV